MRVAAGIFSFWQGAGEAPMPVGPWAWAALSALGDSHSMDTPQHTRLARTHLDGNDAYSDLSDALLEKKRGGVNPRTAAGFSLNLLQSSCSRVAVC